MQFDVGSTTATGRISNTRHKVLAIEFHARSTNTGLVYFGRSDVSSTNGRELKAGASASLSFSDVALGGTVEFRFFYVHIGTAGDRIDWTVILST